MSQILPGVPASVPRAKVIQLLEGLGFDAAEVVGVRFHPTAIVATLAAVHPIDSKRYAVGEDLATHRVTIPLADGEPVCEGMEK